MIRGVGRFTLVAHAVVPVFAARRAARGWNSWDPFEGNLNETGALAVAENMVKYMLPYGYDVLTIDEFWYPDNCKADSGLPDGVVVSLFARPCDGSPEQQWQFEAASDTEKFRIAPAHATDGVVDVYGCSTQDGYSPAYLYPEHSSDHQSDAMANCGGKNQLWSWGSAGELISAMDSSKCLDVFEGASLTADSLDLFRCNGGTNQKWAYNSSSQTLVVAGRGPHAGGALCLTRESAAGTGCADEHGRPQPDVTKWPSSAGGKGFKPFADKIHAMGLRLGIHTLRGSVSKAAIAARSPILGGNGATVDQLATTVCPWNSNWYAVDDSHPATKAWIESVYHQYADWGVDFIKNDCIFAANLVESNIELVSNAIATSGRPMEYSLSPGQQATPEMSKSIASLVNIYRVTGDWHGGNMDYHFQVAHDMEALIGIEGFGGGLSFPDLDMLHPYKNAHDDADFKLQMTLWCISRSPLIYGGDIRSSALGAEDFTLLSNEGVLEVQEFSTQNHQLSKDGGVYVWAAHGPNDAMYVALMNTGPHAVEASASFGDLGVSGSACALRDLWAKQDIGTVSGNVTVKLSKSNGAALFKLSACQQQLSV